MIKREIRLPVCAIVLLSLGGWLLHARIHTVSFDPANPSNPAFVVPFIAGLLSIIAAPLMMNFKETFARARSDFRRKRKTNHFAFSRSSRVTRISGLITSEHNK